MQSPAATRSHILPDSQKPNLETWSTAVVFLLNLIREMNGSRSASAEANDVNNRMAGLQILIQSLQGSPDASTPTEPKNTSKELLKPPGAAPVLGGGARRAGLKYATATRWQMKEFTRSS